MIFATLWIATAVAVATPFVLLYRWLNPPDEVAVTVANIDPSTRLLCLVADTPAGPEPMWWVVRKVGPHAMHPSGCTVSEFDPENDRAAAVRHALWRDGKRYGVLIRDADDNWLIYWFGPAEVHLQGRYWIIGGGEASIHLPPKGRAVPATEELLGRLGFGPEERKVWQKFR
jgi:hypothetical protein